MAYYLDLFSPETYESFRSSGRDVSGFRPRQQNAANRVVPGDRLICYMTKLSRWFGVLEVIEGPYRDDTPLFYPEDDPFVIRFKVRSVALLDIEKAVPIHEKAVWNRLSFTREHEQSGSAWTGKLRVSLGQLDDADGVYLESLIAGQTDGGDTYPVDPDEYRKLLGRRVRRVDRSVAVFVPEDQDEAMEIEGSGDPTGAMQMQALLAEIGDRMGMSIWLPRGDRSRVIERCSGDRSIALLDRLPLNYDDTTLKTIEQIDVLWLSGRAIVRAFEVEHTTSIYSGILRMADLLALQPNLDIKLHIVAPPERRDKVFRELLRPVFSLLERKPLYETCTFIPYDSLQQIHALPHLQHLSDSVLDEYSEEAE